MSHEPEDEKRESAVPGLEQTPFKWTHLNGVICSKKHKARAASVSQVERKPL
jgi:hypothetical protein